MPQNSFRSETTIFALYGSQDRVYSRYDRETELPEYRNPLTTDLPERKVIEHIENNNEPMRNHPIGIVYRNRYIEEGADGKSGSSVSPDDDYAVPLFTYDVVQQLEGRLLDYVDATYADKDQREAQKRVVRKLLWGFSEELNNDRKRLFSVSTLIQPDTADQGK